MSDISQWDVSAASNNDAPPNGFPEGQSPSSVNDAAREVMAAAARWYQDTNGSLDSTGTSNSYALTTNNGHAMLADQSFILFRANHANTGAATLNVDSLGAKDIRVGGSTSLPSSIIVSGAIVLVAYNATDDAYDLITTSANTALTNQNATWDDDAEVQLGTGGDLRLYHNGTNSFIDNETGDLVVTSSGAITLDGVDVTDYARLSQDNTFEGSIILDTAGSALRINNPDGAVDQKHWRLQTNGADDLIWTATDDAGSVQHSQSRFMQIHRDEDRIQWVDFLPSGGELRYGGVEVGFRRLPQSGEDGDYTFTDDDAGRAKRYNGTGGHTYTLNSLSVPAGSVITVINISGNDLTIAEGTASLNLSGVSGTGNLTLSGDFGIATLYKFSSSGWIGSGTGLSQ